jgi:uroporphyrinogen-III synthase
LPDSGAVNTGRQVLITRPEPGASETAARVAAMGFTPLVAPLLKILPTRARLPPPERIAAILLPSGNAIDGLPEAYRTLLTLTVGAATARRATRAGFRNIISADGDAKALVTLARNRIRPRDGALLLACARAQSQVLAAELRGSGFRVHRRAVYEARPVARLPDAARTALTDERTLAVLFFSAETARQFVRLVRAAKLIEQTRHIEAITIGTPAAMALEALPWARIRVAGEPTQDAMLAQLR